MGSSRNNDLAADAVRRLTVCTLSGNGAGSLFIETQCIHGSGGIPYPLMAFQDSSYDLIHTGQYNHIVRAAGEAGDPVMALVLIKK